jgi:hypothetical protein
MVIKGVLVKPTIHPKSSTTRDIWYKFRKDSEEHAATIFSVCLVFLTLETLLNP